MKKTLTIVLLLSLTLLCAAPAGAAPKEVSAPAVVLTASEGLTAEAWQPDWRWYPDEVIAKVRTRVVEAVGIQLGDISCLQYWDRDPREEGALHHTELSVSITGPEQLRGLYYVSSQTEDWPEASLRQVLDSTLDYWRTYSCYQPDRTAPFTLEEELWDDYLAGRSLYTIYAAVDEDLNELGHLILRLDIPDHTGSAQEEEDEEAEFTEEEWEGPGLLIDSGFCGGLGDGTNLRWTLEGWPAAYSMYTYEVPYYKCLLTVSGTGPMADYKDEEFQPWHGISKWGNELAPDQGWMYYPCYVEKIVVEEGVTYIGRNAFSHPDYAVRSARLPDTVTEIGDSAFETCCLEQLRLPAGLRRIGAYAFSQCCLTSLPLPESLEAIGDNAFLGNHFTRLRLPAALEELGSGAFNSCFYLEKVTLPESLTALREALFMNCSSLRELELPDGIRSIGDSVFSGCEKLTELTLPAGLETVGERAFLDCVMLRELELPTGVWRICRDAFSGCSRLGRLTIPETVTAIEPDILRDTPYETDPSRWENGLLYVDHALIRSMEPVEGDLVLRTGTTVIADSAFWDENDLPDNSRNGMRSVTLPEGLHSIGADAFQSCQALEAVELPSTLRRIGASAFLGCGALKNLELPEGLELLGKQAFAWSGLTEIRVPTGVKCIEDEAFYTCEALERAALAEGVEEIGDSAFSLCFALEELELPESLRRIGDDAFANTGLRRLRIPAGVSAIGKRAFLDCASLEAVEADPENLFFAVSDGVLFTGDGTELVWYPQTRQGPYTVPDGVKSIRGYAFSGCWGLTELRLPQGLESIGDKAFYLCTSLSVSALPNSLTHVGREAFHDTPWYQEARESPDGLLYLGDVLLEAYGSLGKSVALREGTRLIADEALWGRTTSAFYLPESLVYVGDRAFYGSALHTVICAAPSVRFGEDAFLDCPVFFLSVEQPWGPGWESLRQGKDPLSGTDRVIWLQEAVFPAPGVLPDSEPRMPLGSANAGRQDYSTRASTLTSYLTDNGDGSLTRVEYGGGAVTVERYDADCCLRWKKTLEAELPIWGGYYAGTDYNFLVFGQENDEEAKDREVLRLVRYTKNWNRVDAVSVYGGNTTLPFRAGSLRMAQAGDLLYIHTCHQIYGTPDSNRHQTNMHFTVFIPAMRIFRQNVDILNNKNYDYVSHSFNQFVLADGSAVVKLDQGDAYPRSLSLWIQEDESRPGYFRGERTEIYAISGEIGDNYTGVSVGGFEASSTHYLTAGNSIDQSRFGTAEQRNIFLAATEKTGDRGTVLRWLTAYGEGGRTVSTPQLVKLSETSFLLLWTEREGYASAGELHWLFLDGAGKPVSQEYSGAGRLSDCQPIFSGGLVRWYVTEGGAPVFWTLDPADPGQLRSQEAKAPVPVPGDFNEDDLITADDALRLVTELLSGRVPAGGDLNGDGSCDLNDAAYLLFRVLFNDPARPMARFVAAAYDENGRLTGSRVVNRGEALPAGSLSFLRSAHRICFFYLDDGCAPLAEPSRSR